MQNIVLRGYAVGTKIVDSQEFESRQAFFEKCGQKFLVVLGVMATFLVAIMSSIVLRRRLSSLGWGQNQTIVVVLISAVIPMSLGLLIGIITKDPILPKPPF